MLNIRFRERTNSWPGFVDLFSNLVIILVFLLIVFVFLWTTTSVFNSKTAAKKITVLTTENSQQAEKLTQMTTDEAEARQLLVMARDQLETLQQDKNSLEQAKTSLENANADLAQQLSAKAESVNQMQAQLSQLSDQYQQTVAATAAERDTLNAQIKNLQSQLDQSAQMTNAQQQALSAEVARLNNLLNIADQRAKEAETQYVEMSAQLNKAMADKIAELSQYQSQFYKAIKLALKDSNMVDVSSDRFLVPSDILFAKGSYKLSPEGKKQLSIIAGAIANLENMIPLDTPWIIRVDGHTDTTPVVKGNAAYKNNTELSLLRATAVVNELIKDGIAPRRLVPSGFGEMYPIANGTDATSLQKNRRIELRLTNP